MTVAGVVIVGAGAWWLNGNELPFRHGIPGLGRSTAAAAPLDWIPLRTRNDGARNRLASLGVAGGPAFVTLTGAEVAAILAAPLERALPGAAGEIQLALEGDHLHLRTRLRALRLAGDGTPGDAASATVRKLFGSDDTLHIVATVAVERPGVAEVRVDRLSVRDFGIPVRLIPVIVRHLRSRSPATDSSTSTAIILPLSPDVGDIRISNGRMTVYRASPGGSRG